jgi:hypothetical protein
MAAALRSSRPSPDPPLDRLPTGGPKIGRKRLEAAGVAMDEIAIEHPRLVDGDRRVVGFDHRLHHALERRDIAADAHLIDARADRRRCQRHHLDGVLRRLEPFEGAFAERVE